ncbi:MAG: flagellar biosynthesis anti-sigma factor FlgM [Burkholderiaceae bacterium]
MKITPSSLTSLATETLSGNRSGGARSGAAGQATQPGSSTVDLSVTARHMASLENASSDINVVKVQALRDALASGELKIDASRIADGLLASARELLK